MRKDEYQRYLASREWAVMKRIIRERCGGKCERCRDGLYEQTHHLTYERAGNEDPSDLQAVCAACHEWLSGRTDVDPRTKHLDYGFLERSTDWAPVVCCPTCADPSAHLWAATEASGNCRLEFHGECGHSWQVAFIFGSGATYLSACAVEATAHNPFSPAGLDAQAAADVATQLFTPVAELAEV